MFRIKICGITSAEDAEMVRQLGGDAVGLNFYPGSRRFVGRSVETSRHSRWGGKLTRVGVFVNASAAEIQTAAQKWSLDYAQLHGDERPELVTQLSAACPALGILKAIRVKDTTAPAVEFLKRCEELGRVPDALLVDAWDAEEYGGTGSRADWDLLTRERESFGQVPVILAGGLDATNVAKAIASVRPFGVDVASGVESSPGKKDQQKTRLFVENAKRALRELDKGFE